MKRLFALLALLACATFAHAQFVETIANHDNERFLTTSGKPVTPETFKAAVRRAAEANKWTVAEAGDKLTATLTIRRHVAIVAIRLNPDANSYAVTYQDSANLNYGPADAVLRDPSNPFPTPTANSGQYVIHRNYNRWVAGLIGAIRAELLRL